MNDQSPLPYAVAAKAEIRCMFRTAALLSARRIHMPNQHVGRRVDFADGTSARVYRETVVDGAGAEVPCTLAVKFRLRVVRGWGHTGFRYESLLNTPLFVGFPGFVSKLWFAHDEHNVYRGIYDWDGADRAEYYARSLWRILAIASVPDSIQYAVLPEIRRDDLLMFPALGAGPSQDEGGAWFQPVSIA